VGIGYRYSELRGPVAEHVKSDSTGGNFRPETFVWNRSGKGKHHAHVTATSRHLNDNKENQESSCNATCMQAVVLMHRTFHYAHNTADPGDYLTDFRVDTE
jgi:hypothetical protein